MTQTTVEISSRAEDLLEHTFDHQANKSGDTRGYYAEFESYGCKPWMPKDIAELIANGFVTAHDQSDYIPTLDELTSEYIDEDDMEDFGGVAFLNMTEKGTEYLKSQGYDMTLEEY